MRNRIASVRVALFVAVPLAALLLLAACDLSNATIYNLKTGESYKATFVNSIRSGGGQMTAEGPDGEHFSGRFSNFAKDITPAQALMKIADQVSWAQGKGVIFGQQGELTGTAVLTGNKGTVLDLAYTVDSATGHGSGVGKDNKGNDYKILF